MTTCPKCAFNAVPPGAETCPRCGVVFAKLATARKLVASKDVLVSTGEIPGTYDVIGPVYFAVSNKGILSSQLEKLAAKHGLGKTGQFDGSSILWTLAGEWPAGSQDWPKAFAICIEELKRQVILLGGDGITWLRQDIDLDTVGFQWFYMQAYGTAVIRRQ